MSAKKNTNTTQELLRKIGGFHHMSAIEYDKEFNFLSCVEREIRIQFGWVMFNNIQDLIYEELDWFRYERYKRIAS